ncbi:hypothetical protein ABBQ38_013128 [Trebouxia sp. C0009 RCD-2024]
MALLKSFPSSQAEDFFAPLPQAITSCLRQAPCIATEDGDWVLPAEAVICKDASAARWQLLAQATSAGVAGAKYIHPDLTILHRSSALQSALGIKSLDVDHYLQVLHSAHAQGMLPGLGMQWCAQMLACIYEMLAAKEPQLRSLHTHGMAHTTGVQSVCQQLQSLPVFPLTSGAWTCLGDDPDHPLFQAGPHMRSRAGAKMVTASTTHADRSERQETGSTTGPLEAALESCGLRVEDMQLRVLAADFVQPAEKDTDSLSQMLQASSQVLGVKSITFKDIIHSHILPGFQSDQACELPPSLLVDICKHIPQHNFTVLSEHYAQSSCVDPKHLRKLFYQLGVTDSIQAPKQTVVLPTASKPTSPWGAVDLGEAPDGGWVIQDHSAEEFEAIVESVLAADDESQAVRSMQFLAEMLSSQWAAHLSHWDITGHGRAGQARAGQGRAGSMTCGALFNDVLDFCRDMSTCDTTNLPLPPSPTPNAPSFS